MMKKMVFSVLICSSLLCLSACEDKAEKRAKLEAQKKEYARQASSCYMALYGGLNTVTPEECKEWSKKAEQAKAELDKLNGIKK
ncbi:MAG: hypothetical protein II131_03600 [Neisseriaceae bacterium]|nr:hypothetical protein [Neisseriaceae bacterium]